MRPQLQAWGSLEGSRHGQMMGEPRHPGRPRSAPGSLGPHRTPSASGTPPPRSAGGGASGSPTPQVAGPQQGSTLSSSNYWNYKITAPCYGIKNIADHCTPFMKSFLLTEATQQPRKVPRSEEARTHPRPPAPARWALPPPPRTPHICPEGQGGPGGGLCLVTKSTARSTEQEKGQQGPGGRGRTGQGGREGGRPTGQNKNTGRQLHQEGP